MKERHRRNHSLWNGKVVAFVLMAALCLSVASVAGAAGTSKRLKIVNGCSEPIWIFYLVGTGGGALVAPNQHKLANLNDYIEYDIPDKGLAGTRFWPGMGCDDTGNNCKIGQSGGPPADGFSCPPTIGCAPPVDSLFEGTFGCLPSVSVTDCQENPSGSTVLPRTDGWDTSMVDGYTLPYKATVTPPTGKTCSAGPENNVIDCSALTFSLCPTDENLSDDGKYPSQAHEDLVLKYPNTDGTPSATTAGCFSPCSKLTAANWQSLPDPPFSGKTYQPADPQAEYYCCPTPPISVDACRQGPGASTGYVNLIHEHCPNAYAYAYDDVEGNFNCPAGTVYTMTFYCPQ